MRGANVAGCVFVGCALASAQPTEASVKELVSARDAEFRGAVISFSSVDILEDKQEGKQESVQTLAFSRDGRYRHELKYLSGRNKGWSFVYVRDKQGVYTVATPSNGKKRVLLQTGDEGWGRPKDESQFVLEKPTLAVGRGLSVLKDSSVLIEGTRAKLEGKKPSGDQIRATIDVTNGLPESIDVIADGKTKFVWRYSGVKKVRGGAYLARASMKFLPAKVQRDLAFSSFELREPTEQELSEPRFSPDHDYQDDRTRQPVFWSHSDLLKAAGSRPLTPDLVQQLSQARLEESERMRKKSLEEEDKIKARQSRLANSSGVLAVLGIVVVVLSGYLAFVKANKARKNSS